MINEKNRTVIRDNLLNWLLRFLVFHFLFSIVNFPFSIFYFGIKDVQAGTVCVMPSFQGYTGLLHTPNALVADEGAVLTALTNHRENDRLQYIDNTENYLFSIGMLPNFEIGGRFTEEHASAHEHTRRDLSAHAKLKLPRIFHHKFMPDIAIGIQDPGGGSAFFQTEYLVLSHEVYPFRISYGYGTGLDRLKGLFGGIEYQMFDWCRIIGEYDTQETHFSLQLITPARWFPSGFRLGAAGTMSSRDDYRLMEFALSAAIPLSASSDKKPELKLTKPPDRPEHEIQSLQTQAFETETETETSISMMSQSLMYRLKELGFEHIVIKTLSDGTISIAYNNNRYNHNELDGLGLVMGTADAMIPQDCPNLRVIMKKLNVPLLQLDVPRTSLSHFFRENGSTQDFSSVLYITAGKGLLSSSSDSSKTQSTITTFSKQYPLMLKPRLSVYPGIRTYIGTELGAFDYLVSVRPDLRIDLWTGSMMGIVWDIPAFWSDNFDDGQGFRAFRHKARTENIMFHQTIKPFAQLTSMFSVGKLFAEHKGIMNETFWTPGTGAHRFSLKAGIFKDDNNRQREVCIGAYRYYHAPLDLSLEAKYGQYWNQDDGFLLKIKRYFRDTAIFLFFRHTGNNPQERSGGIAISLPLTPRQDMKPSIIQVKGAKRWTYEQQIAIAKSGQSNPLHLNLAIVPNTGHGLENLYFDDDRLHEAFIRQHLKRLREAYIKWGATQTSP